MNRNLTGSYAGMFRSPLTHPGYILTLNQDRGGDIRDYTRYGDYRTGGVLVINGGVLDQGLRLDGVRGGRFVRAQLPEHNNIFSPAEVQVCPAESDETGRLPEFLADADDHAPIESSR